MAVPAKAPASRPVFTLYCERPFRSLAAAPAGHVTVPREARHPHDLRKRKQTRASARNYLHVISTKLQQGRYRNSLDKALNQRITNPYQMRSLAYQRPVLGAQFCVQISVTKSIHRRVTREDRVR